MNRICAGLMHLAVSYLTIVFHPAASLLAAEDLRIRELRTQKIGGTVYFHACFESPAEMRTASLDKHQLTNTSDGCWPECHN